MKVVTRNRIITYVVLIIWLIVRQADSFVVLIADNFVKPQSNAWNQLDNWNVWLYGLLLFGSFALIVLVIALNRGDLQRLNMDRFSVVMLLIYGAIGIYSLPYNCFSEIAVLYVVYALLARKLNFGVAERRPWWLGLWAIPVLFAVLPVVGSILDWSQVQHSSEIQQRMSHFLLESGPGAVSEEAVYRGMLFLLLRDWKLSESKILYVQAFLFWIAHIDYLLDAPLFFWIVIPLLGFALGYLALRSKSIGVSASFHIAFNFITLFTGFSG